MPIQKENGFQNNERFHSSYTAMTVTSEPLTLNHAFKRLSF